MNDSVFTEIQEAAEYLRLELTAEEMASFSMTQELGETGINAVASFLAHLRDKKKAQIVSTLLRMSRLPLREPKTFSNFDFERLHGKQADSLKELPTLNALYAHKNIALIGPPGVGKTHLAMAYGRACCEKGLKSYFLKATELNQRLVEARKYGREASTINGLVKPSCLIIDEVGRCVFDKEATRMFFDVIDRRYNKEGPNLMILTSNKGPDKWSEFFSEDSSLLCAIDRIFDDAAVFMIKGNSYRGRKRETITLTAGSVSTITKIEN
ncbi:MAG: ATP-binding protein [Lachnospiraceae bacterium]|nr:ATP-binding protein [Lachnospiraceae bacterium]